VTQWGWTLFVLAFTRQRTLVEFAPRPGFFIASVSVLVVLVVPGRSWWPASRLAVHFLPFEGEDLRLNQLVDRP
jgi:hypothetical protein